MTSKQIAEAVGKKERAVQGWAKKSGANNASVAAKIASAGHGIPADYDLDETVAIIEVGLGKNAAAMYRQNAAQATAPKLVTPDSRLDRLEGMVEKLLTVVAAVLQPVVAKQHDALPAPAIDPRGALNKLVASRVRATDGDYRDVWNELYREALYRLHINLKLCAENRGIKPLDYAEQEGYLPALLAIARAIFGEAA